MSDFSLTFLLFAAPDDYHLKPDDEHHFNHFNPAGFLVFFCYTRCPKVDAMKMGVKEMKKEYKKVNMDEIEVRYPS